MYVDIYINTNFSNFPPAGSNPSVCQLVHGDIHKMEHYLVKKRSEQLTHEPQMHYAK